MTDSVFPKLKCVILLLRRKEEPIHLTKPTYIVVFKCGIRKIDSSKCGKEI